MSTTDVMWAETLHLLEIIRIGQEQVNVHNCLKPSGYRMYRRGSLSEILDFTHRLYLYVLFRILNKQQLFSYTKLNS
jgi:hypothetical protein